MSGDKKHSNRLIHASSPYLLQHAHNPVDWYEWGEEAFEKAQREDKLILVSIGYSACHWCHVMERESFEKEDTAAIMNEYFVCIKVDREERPDVDQVYMDAVQLLTGRGGWPLNCFTLPDGRPLHGGTYYRKDDWEKTLRALADFYWNKRDEAIKFAEDLTAGIGNLDALPDMHEDGWMSFAQLAEVLHKWKANFDMQLGGYNWSPKFPMPNNWELFLQYSHLTEDEATSKAVETTLTKMAEGGIYDQVGGGFARYSTDAFWKAPHFEKMLYDNGQLLGLYAKAYSKSGNELYRKVVYETHGFIQRELTAPEGIFYSAIDADSEGVEGKFYVWKQKELQELLGEDEPLYSLYYSVDAYGNWEHGNNILYKTRSDDELVKLTGISIGEIRAVIEKCNHILLRERDKRVRPGLDDKVITCWNALMIKGYAEAARVFDEENFLSAACRCADFILDNLWRDGKLSRIWKNGKVSIHAFAEDYAALCEALIALYEAGGVEKYLLKAKELIDAAITQFYNEDRRLFYFKSKEDAPLVARKVDVADDVIPAANSMFAKCLLTLGYMFDEDRYHLIADEMLQRVQPKIGTYPTSYSNWLQLMLWKQKGFRQVVVTGMGGNVEWKKLQRTYLPGSIVIRFSKPSQIPLLADKTSNDETRIYVCTDKTCGLPVSAAEDVMERLLR